MGVVIKNWAGQRQEMLKADFLFSWTIYFAFAGTDRYQIIQSGGDKEELFLKFLISYDLFGVIFFHEQIDKLESSVNGEYTLCIFEYFNKFAKG
jgi:hypothetical protein